MSYKITGKVVHNFQRGSTNINEYTLDLDVTEVQPEGESSYFIAEFKSTHDKTWVRSGNKGLTGKFTTRAEVIAAIAEFGNTDALDYRVTEVPSAN